MERIVEQGLLYDFYGALLNEHQQKIYEAYVYENLSLSEIASDNNISRQGVHDIIKRCDKTLEEYENKLKLISRFEDIKKTVEEIERIASQDEVKVLADNIIEKL